MVSKLRRPKAAARSQKTGHAQTVVVERDGRRYFSSDPEDIEAAINPAHTGSQNDTRTFKQKLVDLVRNEIGVDVHLLRIRLDMETDDGEIYVGWESKVP